MQEWLGGAEITPHMRNEDWLMGEVLRKLLTCDTITAYNTNEIRRLNIVLLSPVLISHVRSYLSSTKPFLHFITGQSYKMACYPPSSIQLNI
jgi:hypothetical protein